MCLRYINDIWVFRKSLHKVCAELDKVLEMITDEGGSMDLGKSRFLANNINLIGIKVEESGNASQGEDISA
jgi:hypothetical protein